MSEKQDKRWAVLKFVDQGGGSKSVSLYKSKFTIGRLSDNDLQLDDPYVSRHHAEIVFDGENYVFHDKQSTSGSFVNNSKTTEKILKNGDKISLGRRNGVEIGFEWSGQSPATRTTKDLTSEEKTQEEHHLMSVIDHRQTRYLNTSLIEQQKVSNIVINRLKALYEITSAILSTKTRDEL